MPSIRNVLLLLLLVSASLGAQATQSVLFECQGAVLPGGAGVGDVNIPPIGAPDCEGLTTTAWTRARVVAAPSCGMPTQGLGYLALEGSNTLITLPPGGPLPRPLPAGATEVRIPIPAGAVAVAFDWDFYIALAGRSLPPPAPPPALHGFDVSIVDAGTGLALGNLVYVDGSTASAAPSSCMHVGSGMLMGAETGGNGPQAFTATWPSLPAGAYLSVVAWHGIGGGAGFWVAGATLDRVVFTMSPFALNASAPFGPGSLQLDNAFGFPFVPYVTLLTTHPGAFPSGALAGIDILPGEFLAQLTFGAPPFVGTLDATGSSTWSVAPGVLPSGLTFFGVSGSLALTSPSGVFLSPPITFTIP